MKGNAIDFIKPTVGSINITIVDIASDIKLKINSDEDIQISLEKFDSIKLEKIKEKIKKVI